MGKNKRVFNFSRAYKKRQVSYALRHKNRSYFDYLRQLTDDELKIEYRRVYSHLGDVSRKQILNKFLLENDKFDIIG